MSVETASESTLPELKKFDSDRLSKLMEKRALRKCDSYLAAFNECSKSRLVSIFWACKDQWRDVQGCLKQFNNPTVFDKIARRFVEDGQPSGIAEHGGNYNPFEDDEWLDNNWYKDKKRKRSSGGSGMH